MVRMPKALLAAGTLAAVLSCSAAQAGPPGSTVIVTRPSGFGALTPPVANDSLSDSFTQNASFYGEAHAGRRLVGGPSNTTRYSVFVSKADGLASDDSDGFDNVYVRDAVNETTTLVSRATDGTAANGDSSDPAISADGQYVVFASRATNLVPNVDPNGTVQIYRRDLVNNLTTLVSRADGAAGALADSNSLQPSVSTGGAVAFTSNATNLGDVSGHAQVYLRSGSSTVLASVKSGTTTPGSSDSFGPSISDDGKFVAFTTAATDIGVSDTNSSLDVFRFNVTNGSIALASIRTISPNPLTYGSGDSSGASISGDGHRVAFTSTSTNLSNLDASTGYDVYVHDFNTPATFLASQGGGAKAIGSSFDASISADGAKFAFLTDAANLSGLDTNGQFDVYVNDTGFPGGTSLASRCQGAALLTLPASEAAIAPSGTRVSFTTSSPGCSPQADGDFSQTFTRALGLTVGGFDPTSWVSRPSGTADFKTGTSDSGVHGFFRSSDAPSALSGDGTVAAFVSESDEMSPDDNNGFTNVYARDNKTGVTELISRASGADGAAGNAPSGPKLHRFSGGIGLSKSAPAAISDDGRYVAFTSGADNLVPGDSNGHVDVFVRDRVSQTTTLVSVKSDGTQVNFDSFDADISADGKRVAFTSDGRLDPSVDLGGDLSVYVRDLAAGTTTLASRQTGANADANSDALSPSISADGNHVAFITDANNLAPSIIDNNGVADVYVRDLATDSTVLASTRNGLVTAGDHGVRSADIDGNGTHVAFSSGATNIVGASDANLENDVFLHTLGTQDTVLISRGPGGASGNGPSDVPSISADGNRIAFQSSSSDLIPGFGAGTVDVLVRDVAAGTTTLVSRADGADGAEATAFSSYGSISADGHCVAFDSFADNLVGGPAGTDFSRGYMRALDADCGTPPPPAPAPGPGPAPDTTAPTISGLKATPAKFRVSSKSTAVSAKKKKLPKGTKIKFKLSEAAKVSLKIERKSKGHKKGKKCLARRRTGKRCTIYKAKGTLKRSGKSGANSVAFSGRIGKKKLAKGSYRITATATDAAGNKAKKKTATFRIV